MLPSFNEEDFELKPTADLSILPHSTLLSDDRFTYLKSTLEKYFSERIDQKSKPILHKGKSARWKDHLYTNLQTLLLELSFTKEPEIFYELLDKVYNWYIEKTYQVKEVLEPKSNCESPVLPKVLKLNTPSTTYVSSSINSPSPYRPKTGKIRAYTPDRRTPVELLNEKYLEMRRREALQAEFAKVEVRELKKWGREKEREEENFGNKIEQTRFFIKGSDSDVYPSFTPEVHSREKSWVEPVEPKVVYYDLRPNAKRLEKKGMDKFYSRVNQLRRLHANTIDIDVKSKEVKTSLNSSLNLNETASPELTRPLSAVSKGEYSEIEYTKMKLASKNVPISLRELENGLLMNEGKIEDESMMKLPRGGERLINNPFKKKDKKSKKKGKKKGKKKKR